MDKQPFAALNGHSMPNNSKINGKHFSIERILETFITDETAVPEIEPIVKVKGAVFAVKGDISFISGLPKTGKSTISEIILATALMPEMIDSYDNLGIRAKKWRSNHHQKRPRKIGPQKLNQELIKR